MPPARIHPNDNKEIVRRFIDECWNQGNLDNVSDLVAPNCSFHDPIFPNLAPGIESLRHHIQTCRTGFPNLRFIVDHTIAERNEVVAHWTATGTHQGTFLSIPPTHKHATISGTSIFRLENSKIKEEWVNWDLMSMLNQLGLQMVPKNSPPEAASQKKAHA